MKPIKIEITVTCNDESVTKEALVDDRVKDQDKDVDNPEIAVECKNSSWLKRIEFDSGFLTAILNTGAKYQRKVNREQVLFNLYSDASIGSWVSRLLRDG